MKPPETIKEAVAMITDAIVFGCDDQGRMRPEVVEIVKTAAATISRKDGEIRAAFEAYSGRSR